VTISNLDLADPNVMRRQESVAYFATVRKCSRFLLVAANLLGHSIGGACAFDASVDSKLFVTFGFVFPLHFIK
jgi:hypothetical protein